MWLWIRAFYASEKHQLEEVRSSDKVDTIRQRISSILNLPPKQFRIYHGGRSLEDGETLHSYGVSNDNMLQIQIFEKSKDLQQCFDGPFAVVVEVRPKAHQPSAGLTRRTEILASDDSFSSSFEVRQLSEPSVASSTLPRSSTEKQSFSLDPVTNDQENFDELCSECKKQLGRDCRECGCHLCGKKTQLNLIVGCDECQFWFHVFCDGSSDESELPAQDEPWFCSECKHDNSKIMRHGDKLDLSKSKKARAPSATASKSWGGGNACRGKRKTCSVVGQHHFGHVPGVEVGQTWKYRIELSESGIHRPPVGGISGGVKTGSQSIVLSGGFSQDYDYGDSFLYTGSGGLNLSIGNRRTGKQEFDQKLESFNRALAMTIGGGFRAITDGEVRAPNWKSSKPIRVVRSAKLQGRSKYAPPEGLRYDGIYKLVRYWVEKGEQGFKVIRYEFRRDDPLYPSPWTPEGKKRIKDLGLKMIIPEVDVGSTSKKENDMRWDIPTELLRLINLDPANKRVWDIILKRPVSNKSDFFQELEREFTCPVCLNFVQNPVTTRCGHSACHACVVQSLCYSDRCPNCRMLLLPTWRQFTSEEENSISQADKENNLRSNATEWKTKTTLNQQLVTIIRWFHPGYGQRKDKVDGRNERDTLLPRKRAVNDSEDEDTDSDVPIRKQRH